MSGPANPTAAGQPPVTLAPIALAAGLVPFAVVQICYLIAATADLIPLCVPYLQGCTSVSSAGRYGAAYFLFKAGMLPAATLIGLYWWLNRHWLLSLGDRDSPAVRAMVWTGLVAALFLILYSVFLGSQGAFYNLMRRFGVTVYFGASGLAQLILLSRLAALRRAGRPVRPDWLIAAMVALAVALLVVGLSSIPIMNFLPEALRPGKHRLQNTVEWNFCLLLLTYNLLGWAGWRASGFRVRFDGAYSAPVSRLR